MPALGWAKLRLGRPLDSPARPRAKAPRTCRCAGQALAALIAVLGAGWGLGVLDPIAALLIGGVAAREGAELWRGDECACQSVPGLDHLPRPDVCC
jgi:divalent metal cation (Fe/Co/Zn/Cd) transporter